MKILLTTRRETAERRNPIALLDLAAYWRSVGYRVDCSYLDQLKTSKVKRQAYDLVGLSVLQTLRENHPVEDGLYLKRRFDAEIVIGGKWAQTIGPEEESVLMSHGIKVYSGAGEQYFGNQGIDYEQYPSWEDVDFQTLNDVRSDIMSSRGCPYGCHFCHNTEKKLSFFSARRTSDNIELLFRLGVKHVFCCDDIFTLRASHMEAIYHELKRRGIDIEGKMEFFAHINHIHDEYSPMDKDLSAFAGQRWDRIRRRPDVEADGKRF